MKMSREQLKSLVKECLVELLSEGIDAHRPIVEASRPMGTQSVRQVTQPRQTRRTYDPALDRPASVNPIIREAIKANAGTNKTMASILADTAITTLREQTGADTQSSGASQLQQVEHINGTPEEVFGEEVTSRWAHAAFAAPKPKG